MHLLEDSIKALERQDRKAQQQLYKEYFSRWMALCVRYVGQHDDAMMVLNNGFLKIFTKIDKYNNTGSFEGWMRRIMVNACIDFIRMRRMEVVYVEEQAIPQLDADYSAYDICDVDVEMVMAMIQQLPATTRTVFNMYAIDGYSHQEIATQLNISTSTSAWHVSTARASLKEKLQAKKNVKIK